MNYFLKKQNHLSKMGTCHILKKIWSLVFKKSNIFTFPIVKMNANYAEIFKNQIFKFTLSYSKNECKLCTEIFRVGNLEADFQQVPLVQFF